MNEGLKTVTADLTIEVNVTCPECSETFNLLTKTDLNDEGYVMRETIKGYRNKNGSYSKTVIWMVKVSK